MSEIHHAVVQYAGRVQGVGFRYQTLRVAQEYEVSGYVQNLSDGRVQVEAEGREEEVEAFLVALGERLEGYIRRTERQGGRRAPQFQGFTIR